MRSLRCATATPAELLLVDRPNDDVQNAARRFVDVDPGSYSGLVSMASVRADQEWRSSPKLSRLRYSLVSRWQPTRLAASSRRRFPEQSHRSCLPRNFRRTSGVSTFVEAVLANTVATTSPDAGQTLDLSPSTRGHPTATSRKLFLETVPSWGTVRSTSIPPATIAGGESGAPRHMRSAVPSAVDMVR